LIKDEPRSGRLITKKSEIMEKVERNKRVKQCGDCQGTRHRPQNSFESFTQNWIQKKLDVWVSHELSVKNTMDRINICDTLQKRN